MDSNDQQSPLEINVRVHEGVGMGGGEEGVGTGDEEEEGWRKGREERDKKRGRKSDSREGN